MTVLLTGGSGCGKSVYAEKLVSAMPMDTDKNCSASSGKISRTKAWRLKIGSDWVD